MLLKHVHTDKNDDYKCDICGLKYRFEVTEDVPVELTVPADDTFELVFTPERTGKYTASTLSGGSFYRGDMYVNSFSDGYNRGSVYYLKEGVTYRYVLYSFQKEHTETATITHAHSGERTYTATLIVDGEVWDTIEFSETQESIKLPDVPEKEGYTGTWSDYTLEMKDIEIEAVYKQNIYHATVIADGEIIEVIDFVHGQKSIALPDVPEKEGYTGRWPDYTLGDKDITIEAVYKPNKYTLTYMNGGSAVYSAETAFGDSLTVPRTPQNDGYRFDGWEDEYGNKPGDYASMPARDLTFTAKWTALEFTITFDTDGAGEIAPFTAAFGTPVPEPVAPAKQGYVFKGWSPEIPATMPAQDLTVTAKWEKDATFDTVLKAGGGQTVDYRATVTITAKAENLPNGYFVVICDSAGHELAKGDNKKATCRFNRRGFFFGHNSIVVVRALRAHTARPSGLCVCFLPCAKGASG